MVKGDQLGMRTGGTTTGMSLAIVLVGLACLGCGLMLYSLQHGVNVGVLADQELIDRINRGVTHCTGMSLEKYASASLEYHQSLRRMFFAIARLFILFGVILVLVGGLQLRALYVIRERVARAGEPN